LLRATLNALLIQQHHTIQQFLFRSAHFIAIPIQSAFGGQSHVAEDRRTLTRVLAAAVLLTGFVHFAKTRSVSASGIQSADTSTTAAALTASRITSALTMAEMAKLETAPLQPGDFNRDGQVDVAVANDNFDGVTVMLGVPGFQNDATYPTGAGQLQLHSSFNWSGFIRAARPHGSKRKPGRRLDSCH
jgi:hypothetical protein